MTEHNHHRGTRGQRQHRRSWTGMAPHYTEFWQRYHHRQRRGLVHKLLHADNPVDIPGNTPKHIRWDYW